MGEPLSRVEAILQNILGADNILVPPGSQVEEILQAIYYNTEYEKNPKSRVAEILLAIKNNGVYDGPVLSRMEDILVHKLNNIPYTKHKKEDLSRVEQLLLDWLEQGGGEEIIEYTGTFPMTILANGEPLLDYLISGNTVQSGTPTPDNPIMPQGTGERTGNLFDKNSNTINNTGASRPGVDVPAGTYSINNGTGRAVYYRDGYNGTTMQINAGRSVENISANDRLYVWRDNNVRQDGVMLNEGSTALPYEPYGYKIPISSANITTPVYLGEVETTRKIKKLVLSSSQNWKLQSINSHGIANFYITVVNDFLDIASVISNFFTRQTTAIAGTTTEGMLIALSAATATIYIRINSQTASTAQGFKDWLDSLSDEVDIWYVLAEPETSIVNEPLMKIGDYADTLSMEQAGVDVPTNIKPTETVIDVPTSVKPSEGYIKYTEPSDGPTPKTQVLGTKNHEIYVTSNDEVYVIRR